MRFFEYLAALSIVITFGAIPAHGQLLGGNVSIGGGSGGSVSVSLGRSGSSGGGANGLVSVNRGAADDSALVNLGLGQSDGSTSLADVRLGTSAGALDGSSVTLSGSGGDATLLVGLNLGGLGFSNGEIATLEAGLSSSSSGGLDCSLGDGRQVLALASDGRVSGNVIASWQRASNVQIRPMPLCPDANRQVHRVLDASDKMLLLQALVARDPLIMASLQRTRFDQDDVFAVERQGNTLLVYVF